MEPTFAFVVANPAGVAKPFSFAVTIAVFAKVWECDIVPIAMVRRGVVLRASAASVSSVLGHVYSKSGTSALH